MDPSPSGLQSISLSEETSYRQQMLIDPWMFCWTLNLLSTFLCKQFHSDHLSHIQTPHLKQVSLLTFFKQWGKYLCQAVALLHHYTDLCDLSVLQPYGGCLLPWNTLGPASSSWALSWQFWMQHLSIPQGKSVPRKLLSGSNEAEGFGR